MSASSSSKQERSEDGRSEISPFSAAHAQHTKSRCQLAEPLAVCGAWTIRNLPTAVRQWLFGARCRRKTSLHLSSFGSRTVSSSTTLMMMMMMIS